MRHFNKVNQEYKRFLTGKVKSSDDWDRIFNGLQSEDFWERQKVEAELAKELILERTEQRIENALTETR